MKTGRAFKGTWVDSFLLMVWDRESKADMVPVIYSMQASVQGKIDMLVLLVSYPDNYRNALSPHPTLKAHDHKEKSATTSTLKCMFSSQFFYLL